ncbi:MAG TPA: LysR substrate-binding domain-containing protein, partial [Vineibacter sp.]|nr:LysR substrate-binding domain-containing protein [Vineibacter sp.]
RPGLGEKCTGPMIYTPGVTKRDHLDWNDLRFFLVALRSGTLAGAARTLGVEHSTISRRLAALERSLDAALVIRRPDGLQATPLGDKLMALAQDAERAVLAVEALAAAERKRVRLAVPSGFTAFFSTHLAGVHHDLPGVSLELLSGSRPVDLSRGEAELALRIGPVADEDLIARRVGDVGWSLYAAPAYLDRRPAPVDPRDLTGHDIVGYDAILAAVPGAQWIEKHGAGATLVLRSRELADMVAAAAAGAGLAVLPCMLAETEPALRRLTDDVLGRRAMSLVYRREMLLSETVRGVIAFITSVIRTQAARISGATPATAGSSPPHDRRSRALP